MDTRNCKKKRGGCGPESELTKKEKKGLEKGFPLGVFWGLFEGGRGQDRLLDQDPHQRLVLGRSHLQPH